MKNITLSADERLIAEARQYAQARNTTLNQLVRDYLAQLTGHPDAAEAAREFADLARARPGRSSTDWTFDREAIHRRERTE